MIGLNRQTGLNRHSLRRYAGGGSSFIAPRCASFAGLNVNSTCTTANRGHPLLLARIAPVRRRRNWARSFRELNAPFPVANGEAVAHRPLGAATSKSLTPKKPRREAPSLSGTAPRCRATGKSAPPSEATATFMLTRTISYPAVSFKISAITSSVLVPSASPSKLRMMRWRRAGAAAWSISARET